MQGIGCDLIHNAVLHSLHALAGGIHSVYLGTQIEMFGKVYDTGYVSKHHKCNISNQYAQYNFLCLRVLTLFPFLFFHNLYPLCYNFFYP